MSDASTLGLVLAFAGVCVTQLVGLAAVWLDVRRRSNQTDRSIETAAANADTAANEAAAAAAQAASAARAAEPVSNGLADEIRTGLGQVIHGVGDLSTQLHEVRQKLDRHLSDHASADVRRRRAG